MPFESEIANNVLFTPYDTKCSVDNEIHEKLKEKEFLGKCYSYPVFSIEYIKDHPQITDYSKNEIEDDFFLDTQENILSSNYKQERIYANLQKWLRVFNKNTNSKIYTISGNSGTGKTTFLYWLQDSFINNNQNVEIVILDVSEKNDVISWFGDYETKISNIDYAEKKIFGSILKLIRDILFPYSNLENDYHKKTIDNINGIINNYKCSFQNLCIKGENFFNKLIRAISSEFSDEKNNRHIANVLSKYFFAKDRETLAYTHALDILLTLLRCKDNAQQKSFIICFDNLERFIDNHEIYNRDLDVIRNSLRTYQNTINNMSNHNYKFKFLLSIRCNSARMSGAKSHDKDAMPNDIDVTKWYDTSDILLKKDNWLISNNIIIKNTNKLNKIINDEKITETKRVTGLKKFIEPLFNFNKRLIIDFIGEMLENPIYLETITMFEKYWNEFSKHGASIFAARSIFKEMTIKKLSYADNLFDYFLLKKRPHMELEKRNDYSRQILTILYNKYKTEDNAIVSLDEILYAMRINQETLGTRDYNNALNDLATILFHMNSYNRRNNDWIQFIDIQFHNENKKSVFISEKNELLQLMKEEKNLGSFELVIMDAGIIFLQNIITSIEFFSVRFCDNKLPFFAMLPEANDLNLLPTKDLELSKSIEKIYNKAKEKINFIKSNNLNEIKMYTSKDDRKGINYIEQLINTHTYYIDLIVKYITDKYYNKTEVDSDKLNSFTAYLLEIKGKYFKLNRG